MATWRHEESVEILVYTSGSIYIDFI